MGKSDFKTLLELAQNIESESSKIQSGEYGISEIESALNEIQELQERLIILKYKAIESLTKDSSNNEEPYMEEQENPPKENHDEEPENSNGNQMTIMDGIKQEEESLNEQLSSNEKSLAQKMEEDAIEDLRKAISLNDKFTFIKQLFDEDHAAYEEVIKKLDRATNLDEASLTINEVMLQFSWEEEDDAVQKFKDLINRKFG